MGQSPIDPSCRVWDRATYKSPHKKLQSNQLWQIIVVFEQAFKSYRDVKLAFQGVNLI